MLKINFIPAQEAVIEVEIRQMYEKSNLKLKKVIQTMGGWSGTELLSRVKSNTDLMLDEKRNELNEMNIPGALFSTPEYYWWAKATKKSSKYKWRAIGLHQKYW